MVSCICFSLAGIDAIMNMKGYNHHYGLERYRMIEAHNLGAQVPNERLIEFVPDRPGHDQRYAIDDSKIDTQIGWRPLIAFEQGLKATVEWYLANEAWWRPLVQRSRLGERLGLLPA